MGRRVLRLHICGYSVSLCPIKITVDLCGLKTAKNINFNTNSFLLYVLKLTTSLVKVLLDMELF